MRQNEVTEFEKTYLVEFIPDDLKKHRSVEIVDIFIPPSARHPIVRLRKIGDRFELTKKWEIEPANASIHTEQTINLSKEEYDFLARIKGRRLEKRRYYYPYGSEGKTAEIDVYGGDLKSLVVVDFEFESRGELADFKPPDFCFVDVTQEEWAAAGMLAGKSYSEIESKLNELGYNKIVIDPMEFLQRFIL